MCEHKDFWTRLLKVDANGQTLLGLIEATTASCNKKHKLLALMPQEYTSTTELMHFALTVIQRRDILERFDEVKAGGSQNLAGYLAARVTGILRNELQDRLRKRSVTLTGWETPDMIDERKVYPRYTIATMVGLEVKGSEETGETVMRGSQGKEWAGGCHQYSDEVLGADRTDVFLENLLWELSPEEAKAATQLMENNGTRKTPSSKNIKLMEQARKRLARLGITKELILEGAII